MRLKLYNVPVLSIGISYRPEHPCVPLCHAAIPSERLSVASPILSPTPDHHKGWSLRGGRRPPQGLVATRKPDSRWSLRGGGGGIFSHDLLEQQTSPGGHPALPADPASPLALHCVAQH